jgi:Spy/CpxP family protein refolding chaperone
MRKRILLLVAALMLALTMSAMSMAAFAVSPSQAECEAAGGTFDRSGGQVSCVIVEEGKNPKFTDTETTTGQGNIENKQEQDSACEPTGSGKCPPGQF